MSLGLAGDDDNDNDDDDDDNESKRAVVMNWWQLRLRDQGEVSKSWNVLHQELSKCSKTGLLLTHPGGSQLRWLPMYLRENIHMEDEALLD